MTDDAPPLLGVEGGQSTCWRYPASPGPSTAPGWAVWRPTTTSRPPPPPVSSWTSRSCRPWWRSPTRRGSWWREADSAWSASSVAATPGPPCCGCSTSSRTALWNTWVLSLLLQKLLSLQDQLQTESEGDTLVSAIFITPTRELHRADLTCRAEVANITGYLEDTLRLNVKCKDRPELNLLTLQLNISIIFMGPFLVPATFRLGYN